jgi:hypothetical protein
MQEGIEMCNHPQSNWVGTADGIRCGLCGALVGAPEPVKVEKPKPEPILDPEPEEKKVEPKKAEKKAAPKKGGKK